MTVPVTTASAESFSRLKLIKTYLRTTMVQERLTGLAILSTENGVELQHWTIQKSLVHSIPEKAEKNIFRVSENVIYTC
jgi:hypothetical protein